MLLFVVLNSVLSIDYFQKLIDLQIVHYSLAWLGVYMLGYYNFSIGWMITPLLLRWTKTTLHIYEKHIQHLRYIMISFQRSSRPVEEGEEETLDGCQRGCAHQRTGRNPPFWLFLSLFFFFMSPNFKLFKSRRCLRLVWVSRNSRPGFSFRIRNEQSGWTRC